MGDRPRRRRIAWRVVLTAVIGLVTAGLAAPASAAGGARVDADYTLLRSAPASWVIGTAYGPYTDRSGRHHDGWAVRDEGTPGPYTWARVGGDLRKCVWIYRRATTTRKGRLVAGPCGPARQDRDGAFVHGYTNGQVANPTGSDGFNVRLDPHAGCTVRNGKIDGWGNVEPWRAASRPSHRMGGVLTLGRDGAPHGKAVRWRYISRDGRYVMVHATRYDPNDGHGQQNWFFIQRSCLPAHLPVH